MHRSLVVLGVLVAACGTPRPAELGPNALELCVQNETIGYGNVVARAAQTRFDVQPGQQMCKQVNAVGGGVALQAQTTAGGAAGPLSFRRTLTSPFGCWRWVLNNSRATSLAPCD